MIYIYIHIQQFKFFKWIINIYNHAIGKYFKRSFQSNILNHKHVRINIRPRLRVIKHRARDFVRINAVPIKQAEKKALIRAKSKTRDGCLGPVTIRHFPLLVKVFHRPYFVKGELLHTTNSQFSTESLKVPTYSPLSRFANEDSYTIQPTPIDYCQIIYSLNNLVLHFFLHCWKERFNNFSCEKKTSFSNDIES